MGFLDRSRVIIAAHAVGLAQGALEQAINYVKRGSSSERRSPHSRSLNSRLQRVPLELRPLVIFTKTLLGWLITGKLNLI
jgi:alkylation response protein AidB-like acyl-CoA dehydrogenase